MNKFAFYLSLCLTVATGCETAWAKSYVPDNDAVALLVLDKQQVEFIEQVLSPQSESKALKLAADFLSTANQPGNSQQFQLAERLLAPHVAQSSNIKLRYLWAQIKQHQHLFSAANEQLEQIFKLQPNHVAARLMASRLALIQRDADTAQQHCQNLLGHVDVITTQICLLEVSSYEGQIDSSYTQLMALTQRWSVPETHQTWVTLMLVDMAMRTADYTAAVQNLNKYQNFNDISYLSLWADVMLITDQAESVRDRLGELAQSGLIIEDGLLLRLALAEQQLNKQQVQASEKWLNQLEQRLELLAARDEFFHANEMARYYIDLKPDKKQALYWAQRNWLNSKEHQDEWLLNQAENFTSGDAQ